MQPPGGAGISAPQFSNDGKWYWNGQQWVTAISPDGRYQWTGTVWTPVKKMLFGDHANQSIVCAVIGLLCGFMFLFGLYAGIRTYNELPWKRTQAIVGIALNAVGSCARGSSTNRRGPGQRSKKPLLNEFRTGG
jgi:hypothetical protein